MHENVIRLNNEDIDRLLLNPTLERRVNYLVKLLGNLDDVKKELQRADATFPTARANSGVVLEKYTTLSNSIDSDVRIVNNVLLVSGVLKIQKGRRLY